MKPQSMTQSMIALALLTLPLAPQSARAGDVQGDAYDCSELWQMRNSIYKTGGYCFKTPKTIAQFGNAGCRFDDEAEVPLSDVDRNTLSAIKKSEKRQSC